MGMKMFCSLLVSKALFKVPGVAPLQLKTITCDFTQPLLTANPRRPVSPAIEPIHKRICVSLCSESRSFPAPTCLRDESRHADLWRNLTCTIEFLGLSVNRFAVCVTSGKEFACLTLLCLHSKATIPSEPFVVPLAKMPVWVLKER